MQLAIRIARGGHRDMKRILFAIGLLVTLCNLTVGIAYSALCLGSGGGRACGTTCRTNSDGTCSCTGSCTAEEIKWVEGAGKGGEELLE
jgi:hypothetical protein